ncbi:hypothetical protein F2P81_021832 [Scophthalmus maximus]|uniref:Uncharacterized protein n=1 Tax=Scophthalmus maximus TaxID=52904 RepID=A0A6A4S187_SCOMX|nr:hypothetical protein F2P81_021832 [Scophthalmus maximus]
MSEVISKVRKQQVNLMGLMEEIRVLRAPIYQRDQRIEWLEQGIDDLELFSRANDLIITGLDTKHRRYARATAGDHQGEDAASEELHTLEQQVVKFLTSKNSHIKNSKYQSVTLYKTKPTIVV